MRVNKKVICFGEVLWDNFGTVRTIGGAPLNVCYHLSKANVDASIISQVGNDALGEGILDKIEQWGFFGAFCERTDKHPTSIVSVELLPGNEVRYDIKEQVAWDYIGYRKDVEKQIQDSDAFIYGTLAARAERSRETLLLYLRSAKWPILDLNLRPPYVEGQVLLPLIQAAHTLKLNSEELEFVCQLIKGDGRAIATGTTLLFSHFPNLKEILLTKGAKGATHITPENQTDIEGVSVIVQDTVGSGDSFLAGFVAARLQGNSVARSMQMAVTLSAFVATRQGACPGYTLFDLENLKTIVL